MVGMSFTTVNLALCYGAHDCRSYNETTYNVLYKILNNLLLCLGILVFWTDVCNSFIKGLPCRSY